MQQLILGIGNAIYWVIEPYLKPDRGTWNEMTKIERAHSMKNFVSFTTERPNLLRVKREETV
jgi:hypothetical protein